MKKPLNSNMYAISAEGTWTHFSEHLSGVCAGLWCVVSTQELNELAKNALEKSAAALGYKQDACTYFVLKSKQARKNEGEFLGEGSTAPSNENASTLSDKDIVLCIEAADPLCLLATDAEAASTLSRAYEQNFFINTPTRILGRCALAFTNFEALLEKPEDKQKAWKLLKKLPKLDA